MKISSWYQRHFESQLSGRYVTNNHVDEILNSYENKFDISILGHSEKGENIRGIVAGNGPIKVLAWSQMHGNESTTTKAVFDFLKLISSTDFSPKRIESFLKAYTLYCIPILNPDGAAAYTRNNANDVDLNRDAQSLSQSESRVLRKWFDQVKPDMCLNLHDQRTMYSLPSGNPATVSFLSPAANEERAITASRAIAMIAIAEMNLVLQDYIPNGVGRYDDGFNQNCVGDTFQMAEVPTILFEAGHYPNDYLRESTREYIFYALCGLFGIIPNPSNTFTVDDYFRIPQNEKYFRDVIISNVAIGQDSSLVAIAIRYEEELINGTIEFIPYVDEIGALDNLLAHKHIDGGGERVLLNSHENVFVNEKIITIIEKSSKKCIFKAQ